MIKKIAGKIPDNPKSYEILIQPGLLHQADLGKQFEGLGSRFVIITDDQVASLHGKALKDNLSKQGLETFLFHFPHGEKSKSRQTKEALEDQMLTNGFGRDSCLIALGGGVATDLGGYIAATYCRGIPLIMIPTSLLGMVDASIGGKTGVNVLQGKNLIGAIYQPQKILIDPSFLESLPIRELRNGLVEMIKHGLIADAEYFEFLKTHAKDLMALKSEILGEAIYKSCQIKQKIVEQDEKETGPRQLLNAGHTIGHAIEQVLHYEIPHGEAVAIGLLVESHMAIQLNLLPVDVLQNIQQIFSQFGIPTQLAKPLPIKDIMVAMKWDKKSLNQRPRFVLLKGIGVPVILDQEHSLPVEESIVINALNWMNDALCRH